MPENASKHLTLVETLELTRPYDEAAPLIQAVVRRLEREGVQALIAMQFHTNETKTELGVVLTFSDAEQMLTHINMLSGWEEFRRFAKAVRLVEMRVHGKLNPEAEAWIRRFNKPMKKLELHVAGFVRPGIGATTLELT